MTVVNGVRRTPAVSRGPSGSPGGPLVLQGERTGDLRRVARTLQTLGRHGTALGPALVRGPRDGALAKVAVGELSEAFAELGPTYVKLAQLIASSPGLFPEVLSDGLRSLLDDVPPMSATEVAAVVTEELGAPPEEVFAAFDVRPMASASIAQVHLAVLPDGEEVVVKVQRPGITQVLGRDLRILALVARVLDRTSARGRMANPVGVVEDFAATLAEELNFMTEGRSMEVFDANLRLSGDNDGVRVPTVRWRYTTPRLLTMERIRGFKIDDTDRLRQQGWDLAAILKRGVRAWLEAALQHGFFHGDVHAGNLMVDTEGKIVFLDFGIVGRLQPRARSIIRHGLPALLLDGDFVEVAKAIYELGAVLKPAAFEEAAADIAEIVEPILGKPLSEISYGQVLVDIVRIGTRYDVRLPRELVLVAKQLLYFERYAKLMAPDWSILNDPELIGFLFDGLGGDASGGGGTPSGVAGTGSAADEGGA